MKIGSNEHRGLFRRDFIAGHDPYEHERLPWPALDDASLARIRSVPIWEELSYAVRRVGALIAANAGRIEDGLACDAVELQDVEEAWHARLMPGLAPMTQAVLGL